MLSNFDFRLLNSVKVAKGFNRTRNPKRQTLTPNAKPQIEGSAGDLAAAEQEMVQRRGEAASLKAHEQSERQITARFAPPPGIAPLLSSKCGTYLNKNP